MYVISPRHLHMYLSGAIGERVTSKSRRQLGECNIRRDAEGGFVGGYVRSSRVYMHMIIARMMRTDVQSHRDSQEIRLGKTSHSRYEERVEASVFVDESLSTRVVDRLQTDYLKLFVTQQIADRRGFIARMWPEVNIARNELGQLNAPYTEAEASEDVGDVWDTIMCLRDEHRKAEAKLADLQHWLTNAEEEIVEKQKQLK
ncbi:hypothetical protein Tco_0716194 [Tanacetum coccineum]